MSAQLAACQCAPDSTTLQQVVSPSTHDGLPAPALRFGDDRVMALLSCLCSYHHLFNGLTNKSLRDLVAGIIPSYNARQMTYDLRRLRRKGLIRRLPGSQHYELTDHGRRIAVFFTKTYTRILNPALAELDPRPPTASPNDHHSLEPGERLKKPFDRRIADAAITTTCNLTQP